MVNQTIADYIIQCQKLGIDQNTITTNLLASGWQLPDITVAFQYVGVVPRPTPVAGIAPTKQHRWLWILAAVVIVLLLGGGATWAYYYFFASENTGASNTTKVTINVPNDLLLETITLADTDNAYGAFQQASETAKIDYTQSATVGEMIQNINWDQTFADSVLTQNAVALSTLQIATGIADYQNPSTANPATLSFSQNSSPFIPRELTTLNSLAALSEMHKNHDTEAFTTALEYLQVGHAIAESQDSIVNYLTVNSIIEQPTLSTIQLLTQQTQLDSVTLSGYANTISGLMDDANGAKKSLGLDYAFKAHSIDAIGAGEAIPPLNYLDANIRKLFTDPKYFHVAGTKQLLLDVSIKNLANITGACSKIQPIELPDFPIEDIENDPLPTGQNILGQYIARSANVDMSTLATKRCNTNMLVGVTQLMLMLRAYYQDHAALPTSLDELIPSYGTALPEDPYAETVFQYNPTTQLIYSVGADGTDNGSSTGTTWSTMADPTFSLNFATAR